MKLVDLNCPGCGAALKVNPELSKGVCNYCGREFLIDDEIQKLNITNGVQLGYQQEQGRMEAVNKRRNELLNNLSIAIESTRRIADANRYYQENEQKYRCYNTGASGGAIVGAILLDVLVAPVVCLLMACFIAAIISKIIGDVSSIIVVYLTIHFWISCVIATIEIIKSTNKNKVKIKQNLAIQRNEAYAQYQNTLKMYYGRITFLPPDYRYEEAIRCFYKYVNNSRANDIQQAMNLYEEEMHRLRMENTQLAMLREQQRQSSIQSAQLATQIGILMSR